MMKFLTYGLPLLLILCACDPYKVPMVPSYQQIPVIQVQKDDTLYSLAKRYDTTVQQLAQKNNIADPTALKAGQDLTLPKPARVRTIDQAPSSAPTGSSAQKVQSQNYPKPAQKTAQLDKPFIATGSVAFMWPVKGRLISSFGAKGHGVKNDGINIGAPKGTPIKAAEKGIVVYAGNELKGYGNLLLIRHEKGFMTAYAHADKLSVKTGQVVDKGEKIATVGTTGDVKTPQLHFEIRQKTKPTNPKKYLH